jgi:hypothetical protein
MIARHFEQLQRRSLVIAVHAGVRLTVRVKRIVRYFCSYAQCFADRIWASGVAHEGDDAS